MPDLEERVLTRMIVENGPKLSNSMLKNGMVDEVVIFQSAQKLGEDGKDFFSKDALTGFEKVGEEKFGDDVKITYLLLPQRGGRVEGHSRAAK